MAAQGNELAGVLAAFRPAYQLAAWKRAGQAIAERIEADDPRHSLIAAHLTYYTSGRQFSLIDLPTIRRWRPDCIITLVDDMLDIHSALAQRDAQRHTNFRLRLREILGWRSAEIAMSDLLARNLYPGARRAPLRGQRQASGGDAVPPHLRATAVPAGLFQLSLSPPSATTRSCGPRWTTSAPSCTVGSSSLIP